jgi:hypothetical protein
LRPHKTIVSPVGKMKEQELGKISNQEIVKYFNQGMSISMLTKSVSGMTGLSNKEARKRVETAIYEDYMKNKPI